MVLVKYRWILAPKETHVASSATGRLSQDLSSIAVSVFSAIVGGEIKSSVLLCEIGRRSACG